MPAEQNISSVRRYYEECANDYGDSDKRRALLAADELLIPDFAMSYSHQSDAEATRDRAEHKEFLLGHTRSFPGERWSIEGLVADEQTVACRWRVQATHAETGNPIDLRGADFFTLRHGQLAELPRFLDFRAPMEQLQPQAIQHGAST